MKDPKRSSRRLTEAFRATQEFNAFRRARKTICKKAPDGDGHPVLVIPGFIGDDRLTSPLRKILNEKGYKTHEWACGRNLGLTEKTATALRDRLEEIFTQNGNQKVTLIGHSLGGVFARELAREHPEMVRSVITLGTPFGAGMQPEAVPAFLKVLYAFLNPGNTMVDDEEMAKRSLTPPPVPTTSIFSKHDGIVHWTASLNPDAQQAENIEIDSSHNGFIWNVDVLAVVLERLSQPDGQWQPHSQSDKKDAPKNPDWKHHASAKKLFKKK